MDICDVLLILIIDLYVSVFLLIFIIILFEIVVFIFKHFKKSCIIILINLPTMLQLLDFE